MSLFLKGAKAQSNNKALHDAVDLVAALASEVWNKEPATSPGAPQREVASDPPRHFDTRRRS